MTVPPFVNYRQAWTDFRQITDETIKTAQHLISRTSITKKNCLLDLGGGDGTLLKAVLLQSTITSAVLVDIEKELIASAKKNLHSLPVELKFINQDIQKLDLDICTKFDGILASHVFYLLPNSFVGELLRKMSSGATAYIVLDEPYSMFDSFWIHTAPMYHERLKILHRSIASLPKKYFTVRKSTITCRMKNPFTLPHDKKINVLSFLCYKDMNELIQQEPAFFADVLKEFQFDQHISYNAHCYEVTKN